MLKAYTVYFKYQQAGDKKPGPVRIFRVYAESLEDARRQTIRQANYPNIEIIKIQPH